MNDSERLAQVRKVLGFASPLDAYDNLLGASLDIDAAEHHIADDACRDTLDQVLRQLQEARKIMLAPLS